MNKSSKVSKYYYDFLDIDNGKKINDIWYISTKNRNELLNKKFIYPVVISKYEENIYVSVSDKYFENFFDYIKDIDICNMGTKVIIDKIRDYFSDIIQNFEVKTMYRMYKDVKLDIENTKAIVLNEDTKQYFMNTGSKSSDIRFKEEKWNQMKYLTDKQLVFIAPQEGKIASMSYISDVYNGGGNIVVNTNKEYRNLGYGKSVVSAVNNFAIENSLLPIYFVNVNNEPSVKLAKSLGYKIMATEIVVCIHNTI